MALRKNVLTSRLPPTGQPNKNNMTSSNYQKRALNLANKDYNPVSWSKYFEKYEDIEADGNTFRTYKTGNEGPVLVLLHGGGYSGLTWSLFSKEIMNRVKCQTLAIDIRGHGCTKTSNDDDLSINTLVTDVGAVLSKLFGDEAPPMVVVGHSMGGAIAVHAAAGGHIPNLAGVCVIDVVEGTAMQALDSMQSFLRGRPKTFKSLPHAVQWCYRNGQTRNLESARVSMPGQLKHVSTNKTATDDITDQVTETDQTPIITKRHRYACPNVLTEENEDDLAQAKDSEEASASSDDLSSSESDNFKNPNESDASDTMYTWRIDLSKTEQYWPGWFQGLSNIFLNNIPAPKLLLLASINGLDTDLTVGQMQGKFQMQVLPRCGHAVQEDAPDQVADVLASFLLRNQLTTSCGDFVRAVPCC